MEQLGQGDSEIGGDSGQGDQLGVVFAADDFTEGRFPEVGLEGEVFNGLVTAVMDAVFDPFANEFEEVHSPALLGRKLGILAKIEIRRGEQRIIKFAIAN